MQTYMIRQVSSSNSVLLVQPTLFRPGMAWLTTQCNSTCEQQYDGSPFSLLIFCFAMSDATFSMLGHCNSCTVRPSLISPAPLDFPSLRSADPFHVFHNRPCCVVSLVHMSFAFSGQ